MCVRRPRKWKQCCQSTEFRLKGIASHSFRFQPPDYRVVYRVVVSVGLSVCVCVCVCAPVCMDVCMCTITKINRSSNLKLEHVAVTLHEKS